MKKILALAGVLSLSIAVGATQSGAAPVQHTVQLLATVPTVCNIAAAPTSTATAFSGLTEGASTFTATVSNGQAQASTGTLTFPSVVCNGSNIKVSLDPGGKPITTGTGANANQKIHYKAEARNSTSNQLALVNTSINLSPSPYGSAGYASGSILIIITILEGTTTLLAGNYTGTLTVNIDTV